MLLRGNNIMIPVRRLAGNPAEPATEYGFDWTPRPVHLRNEGWALYPEEGVHLLSPISYVPRQGNGLIGSYYASFYTDGSKPDDTGKMSILYPYGERFYRSRGSTTSWKYGWTMCFNSHTSTGLPMTLDGSTDYNCGRMYNTYQGWNKLRVLHFYDDDAANYNGQGEYDVPERNYRSMMCDLTGVTLRKAIAYFIALVWFDTEYERGRTAEAAFLASPEAYISWLGKCNSDPNTVQESGYSLIPLDKQRKSVTGEHHGFPAITKVLCSKAIGGKNYYSVIAKSDVNDTVTGTTISNAEADFSDQVTLMATRSATRGGTPGYDPDVPDERQTYIVSVTDISMPYLYVGSTDDEYEHNLANWDIIGMGVEYYKVM